MGELLFRSIRMSILRTRTVSLGTGHCHGIFRDVARFFNGLIEQFIRFLELIFWTLPLQTITQPTIDYLEGNHYIVWNLAIEEALVVYRARLLEYWNLSKTVCERTKAEWLHKNPGAQRIPLQSSYPKRFLDLLLTRLWPSGLRLCSKGILLHVIGKRTIDYWCS
jgi:hypothetical protein